jgi:hypothetical protein
VSGSRRFTSPLIPAPRPRHLIALAALGLAGCGTKPLPPADPIALREPGRPLERVDPRTGLHFDAPRNWVKRIRQNPGMFRLASGQADVSGWAYPRAEKLPSTRAELETARDALVAHAKTRNPTYALESSKITKVQDWPAIELLGTQRIQGRTIRTRSVHIYRAGEYVIEALAPPSQFAVANEKVLEPLLRSLEFRPLPES